MISFICLYWSFSVCISCVSCSILKVTSDKSMTDPETKAQTEELTATSIATALADSEKWSTKLATVSRIEATGSLLCVQCSSLRRSLCLQQHFKSPFALVCSSWQCPRTTRCSITFYKQRAKDCSSWSPTFAAPWPRQLAPAFRRSRLRLHVGAPSARMSLSAQVP